MIRILLADDQDMVRSGLAMILDAQPDMEVVAEADDGARAVALTRQLQPDVVLMDVRMPQLDGIEATRRALQASPRTRVLVLTTFDIDEYVYEALRAGASGFLLKDSPRARLLHAVRVIADGEELLDATITRRLIEDFVRRPAAHGRVPERLVGLTSRELDVLARVARGMSNAEIAGDMYLSHATVKTHVAAILRKLDLRNRTQAVVFAYEAGLVVPGRR
ncbi:MAG: response regulator transcription factor [Actinobacteria bacterium]|nr:response regulator transcription factor [Actinomycetota bacterium]